jgi:CBS domain-containing protein
MARPQPLKDRLQQRLSVLRALRDEIKLDLHLASMELRDEWKELEDKVPDATRAAAELKGATSKTLDRLAGELKQFRRRVRRKGTSEGGVGRIMTRGPATCAPSDSLARALTIMFECDIGFLPVVGDGGRLLGVITDRDAAIAACTRGKRMDELPVEAVMNRTFAACTERDEPSYALAVMRARRVRRLPVTGDHGRLVGVVTLVDIARAAAQPTGRGGAAKKPGEALAAMLAITEPTRPALPRSTN